MSSRVWWSSLGFARRQLIRSAKSPALLLPPLLFPLLLFGAFAGGLAALGKIPGFDYPNYTTFQFVWILLVGMALSAMATGLALAQDFESGFARRMLLATGKRSPIVFGYLISSLGRAVVIGGLLFAIGLIAGMEITSNVLDLGGIVALAVLFNVLITLWAIGIALRLKSLQAAPLLQTPVFIALFLVPVYTPRDSLAGWVKPVADVNPLTPIVEAGRGLIVGEPERVAVAFAAAAGLIALLAVFAFTGLRRAG
jgi:ABC-type multidrug transport system permease subunit